MEDALRIILEKVEKIPYYIDEIHHTGTFVVFDSNAYPIVTSNDSFDVLFAAAEYDGGRIFATSHELYLDKFLELESSDQFYSNIKSWLSHGEKEITPDNILRIENIESVNDITHNVKIIIWNGIVNKSELFIIQLLKKYVSNGGSILCGASPLNWLNHTRRCLDEMSLNIFLSYAGICFSVQECEYLDIDLSKNQAINAHFGRTIESLSRDTSLAVDFEYFITNGIKSLPINNASKLLDRIQKILYSAIHLTYIPTFSIGIKCPIGRSLLNICSKLYQKYSACGVRIKAPNIEEFPGDILTTTRSSEVSTHFLSIKSKFDEFHCTGLYAPAGYSIKITVLEGNPTGWDLRIGCHTDDLSEMECFNRWPFVCSSIKLKKSLNISTAFGGLIYLDSPRGNSSVKIKIENAIQSPFFDSTNPETIQKWDENRHAPGLWAELAGRVSRTFLKFLKLQSSDLLY
jgi:hypothetical protein